MIGILREPPNGESVPDELGGVSDDGLLLIVTEYHAAAGEVNVPDQLVTNARCHVVGSRVVIVVARRTARNGHGCREGTAP